jgi:pyridoxal phosphate enzyme (YggS family)
VDAVRRAEVEANLTELRERIAIACAIAGRRTDEVHIIAVTKTWPVEDVRILCDLGLRDFGENRDQEASAKSSAFAQVDDREVRWHFIGQLQSNKARSVLRYASMVHTVDRPSLADALRKAAIAPLDCLLQVSIDGDLERGGASPSQLAGLLDRIEDPLRLRGVMAVAPLDMAPAAAFKAVAAVHASVLELRPDATIRCIGMSDDFEIAIAHGATHIRVGSALLGHRAVR